MSVVIHQLSRSVVLRITSLMISVILMALISIFSSMYMSKVSEYDGKTINLSGSLRMMSYRITTQVAALRESPTEENRLKVQQLISRFEVVFNDPVLKKDFMRFNEVVLQQDYQKIQGRWNNVIRPKLSNADANFQLEDFLPELESFVGAIDNLVFGYQVVLEDKLSQLKIIQTVTLSFTLILILISVYSIHRHIARPLKELTRVAEASSNGDWSQRSNVRQADELGILSKTLNKANASIQAIHHDLEQRIKDKTRELSQNNEILTFLYQVAQQVNESRSGHLEFQAVLEQLSQVSSLNKVELRLFAGNDTVPYQHIIVDHTDSETHPQPLLSQGFIIERNETVYGEVRVYFRNDQPLKRWQTDLAHSLVDQLAMALSLSNHLDQQRRIALLDERAIIARELHDSLAQSLSYLKIQVARIEKGMQEQPVSDSISEPVMELKEGLISAYRQLRELLTTFRLQIGDGGLQSALSNTIKTLSAQSNIDIQLHYDCPHIPFEPNEEIHLLQITKEALQNALKHSQGSQVIVSLIEQENKSIALRVKDNGVGIRQTRQQLNHYGTEIMQERCHSLNGKLEISSPPDGGTEVNLCFTPNYLNKLQ